MRNEEESTKGQGIRGQKMVGKFRGYHKKKRIQDPKVSERLRIFGGLYMNGLIQSPDFNKRGGKDLYSP
jgi:hypothetical protein